MRSTAKSGRVLSAANEAALRAAVDAISSVLQQLDAGQEQELHLTVDGKRLPDVDDLSNVLAEISEEDLRAAIAKVVVDQVMLATGKVD